MNEKLIAMIDQRIGSMDSYTEQADFLETVQDTLKATGQLTDSLEHIISSQWDKINEQFMSRSVNGRALLTAI